MRLILICIILCLLNSCKPVALLTGAAPISNNYVAIIDVCDEGDNQDRVMQALFNISTPVNVQVFPMVGIMGIYQIRVVYASMDENKLEQLKIKLYGCPSIVNLYISRQ